MILHAWGSSLLNEPNHASHTPLQIAIKKKCFQGVIDLLDLASLYGIQIDTSKLCGKNQMPIFFLLCEFFEDF